VINGGSALDRAGIVHQDVDLERRQLGT